VSCVVCSNLMAATLTPTQIRSDAVGGASIGTLAIVHRVGLAASIQRLCPTHRKSFDDACAFDKSLDPIRMKP
jgi:hypothetical protein